MNPPVLRVTLVFLLAVAFGCDVLTETSVRIGSVEITAGNDITAAVGSEVTASARVVDGSGNGVEGIDVTFTVVSGGGSVDPAGTTSGPDGAVSVTWTLGTTPGNQRLRATVGPFQPTFTVASVPGPVATLTVSPDAVVFDALEATRPITVTAADQYGNETDPPSLSWTSDDEAVADVDAEGLITARGNGATAVNVASGSVDAQVAVTVAQVITDFVVTPAERTLTAVGDTAHLNATGSDANGFDVADVVVGWSTDNDGVVQVDAGVVTAIASGAATVTAAVDGGGPEASAAITVAPAVASLDVTPDSVELISSDATAQLDVAAADANGNAIADPSVTWSVLDDAIATVDGSGLVAAVAEGTTRVIASAEGEAGATVADTAVVVVAFALADLALSIDSLHFDALADTITVTADGLDSEGDDLGPQDATWLSTDTLVATVDANGNVVATGNGVAQLVATVSEFADTSAIVVAQLVDRVEVDPAADTLFGAGDTSQLTGTALDANGFAVADTVVAWASVNTDIATVDAGGLVTAVAPGTVGIVGSADGKADTAEIAVLAVAAAVTVTPDTLTFTALGDTLALTAEATDGEGAPAPDVEIAWTSLDTLVATVDTVGNVAARAEGTTQVVASAPAAGGGTVADTAEIVVAPEVASLVISPDTTHLTALGETAVVEARGFDANGNDLGTQTVSWNTLDPGIATVDTDGVVTAVENGGTSLTATLDALADTVGVGVFQVVDAVVPSVDADTVAMADTVTFGVSALDALGNDLTRPFTTDWSSLDEAVATVDAGGGVEGVMVGATTIVAGVEGVTGEAAIKVAPHPSRSLAVSLLAACALDVDGAAHCWGENGFAQLGNSGAGDFAGTAQPVTGGHTFHQLVGGVDVVCGLDPAGQAYCWGDNVIGGIGNGTMGDGLYHSPEPVTGGHTFTVLDAQWNHVCGLDETGAAWCWGYGPDGQLGDGLDTSSGTPVAVAGGLTFTDIAPGATHTCGLTDLGEVYCWGGNASSQFGDGTTTGSSTPVAAASGETFASLAMDWWGGCGVKDDNTAMCWGFNGAGRVGDGTTTTATTPVSVIGGYSWLSLSPANGWTCGLTTDGTATCVGSATTGRTGTGSFENPASHTPVASAETFVAVDTELRNSCGLTTTGNVLCWGESEGAGVYPFTTTPTAVGVAGFTEDVTISGAFSCALDSDGTLRCWGTNFSGQLGDGSTTHSASPVTVSGGIAFSHAAAGWDHACAVSAADSLAYCWGSNHVGLLGDGSVGGISTTPTVTSGGHKYVDISAGEEFTCGLTEFGEALCWGGNSYFQTSDVLNDTVSTPTLASDSTFVALSAGNYHACGLTAAGNILCWGRNDFGQLGATSFDDCDGAACSATPLLVSGGLTFDTLSAGGLHTCGITDVGETYCWGLNNNGQLGDGTFANSATPVLVSGGLAFNWIAAAGLNTCAIDDANGLYCWGDNHNEQLADETLGDSEVPVLISVSAASVEGSSGHICAGATGGDTFCWGYRNYGQTADGMAFLHTPTAVDHGFTPFTAISTLAVTPGAYFDTGAGFFAPVGGSDVQVTGLDGGSTGKQAVRKH